MPARTALAALAVAAMTFTGLWLVSYERERAAAGAEPQRAARLLAQARRAQPDAGPDVGRAQALAAAGRPEAAVALLRRVVASEPSNALAWGALAALLAPRDAAGARRAAARAAALTGGG